MYFCDLFRCPISILFCQFSRFIPNMSYLQHVIFLPTRFYLSFYGYPVCRHRKPVLVHKLYLLIKDKLLYFDTFYYEAFDISEIFRLSLIHIQMCIRDRIYTVWAYVYYNHHKNCYSVLRVYNCIFNAFFTFLYHQLMTHTRYLYNLFAHYGFLGITAL